MTRLLLPTLALALVLGGCGSDTICPVGFYALGSACIPFEATDVTPDSGESDLGDAGVIDDTATDDAGESDIAEDSAVDDTQVEDVGQPDTEPDVTEPDAALDTPDEDVCTPDCAGFECGPDGCGGICGSCGGDESCIDGTCERDPVPAPSSCPDGFECVASCGFTAECLDACGVFSADAALEGEIISALECAESECGGDPSLFGWDECAEESCESVRSCYGVVDGDGACTNSADSAVLAGAGGDVITGVMGDCTIGCFSGGDPAPCISECVEGETGLSSGCSDCFGQTGACTLTSCIFDCLTPDSPTCAACVQTNCGGAFSECAGLGFPG